MSGTTDAAANGVVTGADYVAQITRRASDRRARAAFRDLVLGLTRPGSALLDFGCGTGLDARFYAGCGLQVFAYDVDAHMCDFFRAHCRDLIETGTVRLEEGPYREFIARQREERGMAVDLVTANFAPLNLVEDLNELFAAFHARTAPQGKVLASVLSPYFIGDLRYRWWWRNLPRLRREGYYCVRGAQAPVARRRLTDFAARSAPYFTLQRVFRGLPVRHLRRAGTIVSRRTAWLSLTSCRYIFLLFDRHPDRRDGADLSEGRARGA
jgi:SAM-dependent methyltransferase